MHQLNTIQWVYGLMIIVPYVFVMADVTVIPGFLNKHKCLCRVLAISFIGGLLLGAWATHLPFQ